MDLKQYLRIAFDPVFVHAEDAAARAAMVADEKSLSTALALVSTAPVPSPSNAIADANNQTECTTLSTTIPSTCIRTSSSTDAAVELEGDLLAIGHGRRMTLGGQAGSSKRRRTLGHAVIATDDSTASISASAAASAASAASVNESTHIGARDMSGIKVKSGTSASNVSGDAAMVMPAVDSIVPARVYSADAINTQANKTVAPVVEHVLPVRCARTMSAVSIRIIPPVRTATLPDAVAPPPPLTDLSRASALASHFCIGKSILTAVDVDADNNFAAPVDKTIRSAGIAAVHTTMV